MPVGPIPFNLFMPAFVYPGETPSIPQKIIMRWTAQFTCDTQLLLDDDRLMLLKSTDFQGGLGNVFQNEVSVPDFLAIVNAKKVEVQFCDTFEAVFTEDYMNALRDLASRMQ